MNLGRKSDKETMSIKRGWRTTSPPSTYCGQQHVAGGCNANFVERFLDNIVNPSSPKTAAVSAYFVLFTTHVCYIGCLSVIVLLIERILFRFVPRGILRRRIGD